LNPFGENKRKCVFNLHRIPTGSPIIITEGVFSAMAAGNSAVATYGKYVSDIQLRQILNKKPSVIYVALDPDALKEATELCERILKKSPNTPVHLVNMPDGKDPSDLEHASFMQILLQSYRYTKASNLLLSIFS